MSTLKRSRSGSEGLDSRTPSPVALRHKKIRLIPREVDTARHTRRRRHTKPRAMYFQVSSPGPSPKPMHLPSSTAASSGGLYDVNFPRAISPFPVTLPPLRVPTPQSMPIAKPKASPYTYMTANHFLTRLERCITSDPYHPLPGPPSPAPAPVAEPIVLPPIRSSHYRGLPISLATLLEPPPAETPLATHSASTISSHRTPRTPHGETRTHSTHAHPAEGVTRMTHASSAHVPSPKPDPHDPQDELLPVRRQLARAQRRLDDLAAEFSAVIRPSGNASDRAQDVLGQLSSARCDLEDMRCTLDDARFSLSRQRNEANLQSRLAEARFVQLNETEGRLGEAEERLQASQRTEQRLRGERDEARLLLHRNTSGRQNAQLYDEMARLRDDNMQLHDANSKLHEDNTKLHDETTKLADDNAELLRQRDEARAYGEHVHTVAERMSREHEWLRENEWLRGEKAALRSERKVLRGEKDALRGDNATLREHNQDLLDEVYRLRHAVRQGRALTPILPGLTPMLPGLTATLPPPPPMLPTTTMRPTPAPGMLRPPQSLPFIKREDVDY